MYSLYKIGLSLDASISFALGVFVLTKNPRSRINVTWFLMSSCVASWALGFRIYMFMDNPENALIWCRISEFFAGWISVFFAHFCLALVGRDARKNTPLKIGYLLNIFMIFCVFNPQFVPSVSPKAFAHFYVDAGPLFAVTTFLFFFYAAYAHWILIDGLRTVPAERRNQVKYALLAGILGFFSGSAFFLPAYDIDVNPITGNFIWLYGLIITYAIVRYRLMDITVVIQKSVSYSILVAVITSMYFLFVLLTERFLQGVMGYRSLAPSLLTAFVVALGFTPLKNWIQSFVDRYFFRGTQTALAAENARMRQELERSERMKSVSVLATGLAHEIKNPLSAIRTFVSYLPERYDDVDFREKFTRIVGGEVERINGIVQQLLNFAKPAPLELKPVDINHILQDTLTFLTSECVKRRVEVRTDWRANHAPIQADPNQLRQVFLNLILNSLEAMEAGGQLQVTTRNQRNGIEVTITDSGRGMPPDVAARVFEPFYTTKDTGVGLGLPIVRGIVERHGGTVAIDSQPQHGTHVTIFLPVTPPNL